MTSDEIIRLREVETLLGYPAGMDHLCDDENCTIENPVCSEMHTKAAMRAIRNILDPPMKSLHPTRTAFSDSERVFLEEWQKENDRTYTTPLLNMLLRPEKDKDGPPVRITQRDAEVATTIIQWLGTNCGGCFVDVCLKRIKELKAMRGEWSGVVLMNKPASDRAKEVAEMLTAPFLALKRGEHFMNEIRLSIAAELDAAYARGKADALRLER